LKFAKKKSFFLIATPNQWRATRGQLVAIATPEKTINSFYIFFMEKLCLSKELLNENKL
jgi:hypothetical protein